MYYWYWVFSFPSFMAAVLTAVLQNHLAWVSTVMPAGTAPSRAFLDKHSSKTVSLNVLLLVVEIYCLNKGCLPWWWENCLIKHWCFNPNFFLYCRSSSLFLTYSSHASCGIHKEIFSTHLMQILYFLFIYSWICLLSHIHTIHSGLSWGKIILHVLHFNLLKLIQGWDCLGSLSEIHLSLLFW